MEINPEIFRGRRIFNSRGCQNCSQTGYKGRGGIFEILPVSDTIRAMVTDHRPSLEIRYKAIEEGMATLRDDGWEKVFAGFTTIEEVLRVAEDQED